MAAHTAGARHAAAAGVHGAHRGPRSPQGRAPPTLGVDTVTTGGAEDEEGREPLSTAGGTAH